MGNGPLGAVDPLGLVQYDAETRSLTTNKGNKIKARILDAGTLNNKGLLVEPTCHASTFASEIMEKHKIVIEMDWEAVMQILKDEYELVAEKERAFTVDAQLNWVFTYGTSHVTYVVEPGKDPKCKDTLMIKSTARKKENLDASKSSKVRPVKLYKPMK